MELYAFAVSKLGQKYTLIEWDIDVPGLSVLVTEAHKAHNEILKQFYDSVVKEDAS